MIRKINFIGRRGTYDLPSFLLTENETLTLKLEGLDARLGRYVMTIRHGTNVKTVYLRNALTVDISPEWLSENAEKPIECFLELRDNSGTQVLISSANSFTDQSGYYIEPLKLERIEKTWSLVAWLQKTDADLAQVKDAIQEINIKLAEYEENGIPLKFED